MNIAEELEPIARKAAKIVGQQRVPGDFIVLIHGEIVGDKVENLGWEWFWQPPSPRVPSSGSVDLT
jgi:hypothetical protein